MRVVSVTKPGVQRKRLFQAPLHLRYKQFAAPLSAELKRARGFNALPVRRGDTVRVMRGDRKGIEGKVSKVDRKAYRISVEGVTREKVDGTAIPVLIHPSKVMIINLNLDDKWRRDMVTRKEKLAKGEVVAKPAEKAEKKSKKKRTRKAKVQKKPAQVKEAKEAEGEPEKPEKKKPRRRIKKKAVKEEAEAEKQPEEE